jgi:2-keto-4-pentenoate hydratase/2-oxohepta-3-ene-1,7-dioic acid hydratase in catechol pathway
VKIARFSTEGSGPRFGIIDGDGVVVLAGDPMFSGFEPTGERVPLESVRLLAPVIPRSKVVGVGRNYAAHAAELGNEAPTTPLLFFKPNTTVIGPGDAIVLPEQSDHVDYEGELAVVIGRMTRNVSEADALDHVFGYTVANDVTARDLQQSEPQWARAKGFDTFCPLGPVIETEFELGSQAIGTRLNEEIVQLGTLDQMIHSVRAVIAFASSAFTLLPGDVILTGTPAGVGPLTAGDSVEVTVEGIGTLTNPVR